MSNTSKPQTLKEHCNTCLGWKNHEICYTERVTWDEEVDPGLFIHGGNKWELLKCMGCDAVRLKHQTWFSEDCDERGEPNIDTKYFPPTVTRQKPQWRRQFFPYDGYLHSFDELFDEIYEALALGSTRLAAMGIRALVEKLMIDQVGDRNTFEANMAAFFEAGFVSQKQRSMFKDTLLEAGHAAMHRDFKPSVDTVNTLLDIVEGIMHQNHYAPMLADVAKKTIPGRQRRKR